MNKIVLKKEKKDKSYLYELVENVATKDALPFKEKLREILNWSEKQLSARYYGITEVSNAEVSLVNRLYLAYKEDRDAFFLSTITDYNYHTQYKSIS